MAVSLIYSQQIAARRLAFPPPAAPTSAGVRASCARLNGIWAEWSLILVQFAVYSSTRSCFLFSFLLCPFSNHCLAYELHPASRSVCTCLVESAGVLTHRCIELNCCVESQRLLYGVGTACCMNRSTMARQDVGSSLSEAWLRFSLCVLRRQTHTERKM